jgi:molybdopterin synthase sulfur carrier subunit
MVRLQLYGLLRLALSGKEAVELPWHAGDTVGQLLKRFQDAVPIPVNHKLIDTNGAPHTGTIILLNRKNIVHLDGMNTALLDGDVLALFPPGAGG